MYFVDHHLLYFGKYAILQFFQYILTFIPSEQFEGSSTSDAGISLASTIASAINQQAEVKLVT